MSMRLVFRSCFFLLIVFLSYQFYQVNKVSKTPKSHETKKAPIHVLIISSWRSGSSFLGQIFNHHPDVFYIFEPGHSIWMRLYNLGVNLLHYPVRDLIHSLFNCDVTPMQQYVSGDGRYISGMGFFGESRALCLPPTCPYPEPPEGYNRTKCYEDCKNGTFDDMAKVCHTYNYRVMKTVRILDFSVLLPLFRDPNLDLRIIHLVRDPRAVASSRKYFSLSIEDKIVLMEHDKDTKDPIMAKICKAQANINRMAKAAGHLLEKRYMLIRHEDLSREPVENAQKIFKFSGLKMTQSIEEWIYNNTHDDVKKKEKYLSYSKESLKVIQQWRKIMDFKKVKEIEKYCKEFMDLFGYLPVNSAKDQKNMSLNFVL
ncbi:carbohydrate sulfotransferase 4-like [Dendropsophus ebraccatus]|uniref:carbohydrate sulfotransferase 4-like n=1 Tax=Dendropsophus ebraccatus TaxID=150705 RepID=UPI0038311A3A